MARTTISLPDALKGRMDAVKEPVNWSQVAASAFEVKLGEIASRQERINMEDVIQRLRASKLVCDDSDTKNGAEAGVRWAQKAAEWDELERLASHDFAWNENYVDEPSWEYEFLTVMNGEEVSRSEVEDFWERILPDGPTRAWFQGFQDGAESVYRAVASKL